MAVNIPASSGIGVGLMRTTDLPPLTALSSLTLMGWWKIPAVQEWSFFGLLSDENAFKSPYVWLGSDGSTGRILWEWSDDGITRNDIAGIVLPTTVWLHIAWVINGTSHKVYVSSADGAQNATLTIDTTLAMRGERQTPLGDALFSNLFAYVDYFVSIAASDSASQIRIYERALTQAQVQAERDADTLNDHADIYLSAPLATGATALNDTSGQSHNWSFSSTEANVLQTDSGGDPIRYPFNQSAAAAITIVSLDYAVNMLTNGQAKTIALWWKYVAQDPEVEIGLMAFADTSSNFVARIEVYRGTDASNLTQDTSLIGVQRPIEIAVTGGEALWFRVAQDGAGTPLNANLLFSGKTAPRLDTIPSGSILISADTSAKTQNAIFLAPTTGTVLAFRRLTAGEMGTILANGVFMMEGLPVTPSLAALYTRTFELITADPGTGVSPVAPGNLYALASDRVNTFYMAREDNPVTPTRAVVRTMNAQGIIGGTTWTLPVNSLSMKWMGVNRTNTILYYTTYDLNTPIRRWDLSASAAMTDLVAGIANYRAQDIYVLSDNTILVGYQKNSVVRDYLVKRYSVAGAVLNTYSFGATAYVEHLAIANDDANSFWVMLFVDAALAGSTIRFSNIKVSDGSTISTFDTNGFFHGVSGNAYTNNTPQRFGPPQSCPLLITAGANPVPVIAPPAKQWGIHRIDTKPRAEQSA